MSFDDKPVGGGDGGVMPRSPGLQQAEDFSRVPLNQLPTHSNWKARKEGFDRIASDPQRGKQALLESASKVSAEGNAAAQESLLEALVSIVPICSEADLGVLCDGPLAFAIEKGATGRPKAVQGSQKFLSLLVENAKHEEVFGVLLPAFSNKTPKNRMAAAQLGTMLIGDFGVAHFPLKEILKRMQVLFNDVNPQVRKEAAALCCQCYKFMGAGIKGFLTDLRDVQLHELEKQFEQVKVGEKPHKTIKGVVESVAVRKSTTKTVAPVGSLVGGADSGEIDDAAFELLDETPVIPKISRNFFRNALDKEVLWQERCSLVSDTLLPLLSVPRFRAKDDYHELAGFIRQYLLDPQAPPMLLGFKMIQECARGLRGGFAVHARTYLTPLFDKMKDKKTSVLEHIMVTLEKLISYHCVTLDQCHEDMEQASQSKNPSQRLALMIFLLRMLEKLDQSECARLTKAQGMLKRMVNDDKASNKDVAYRLLHELIVMFGDAPFKSVLATLDEKQRVRFDLATAQRIQASQGTPTTGGSATPSTSPAKKLHRMEVTGANHVREPPLQPSNTSHRTLSSRRPTSRVRSDGADTAGEAVPRRSRTSSVRTSLSGSTRQGRSGASSRSVADDSIYLEGTLPAKMESVNTMLGLMNGDTSIYDLVRSREWSQRYDGMAKIKGIVAEWSQGFSTTNFNYILVFLRYFPSFRESTFQVFQMVLAVLQILLTKARTVSPGAGYVIVSECTPRLTDAKNRQSVREMCSVVAERLSVRLVARNMMFAASQVKTPKLLQECNEYIAELLRLHTTDDEEHQSQQQSLLEASDVKLAVNYVKQPCFEQHAQPVRASAIQLLMAVRRTAGAGVVDAHVSSFPPPMKSQYEAEVQRGGERILAPGTGSGLPPAGAGRPSANRSLPTTPVQKRARQGPAGSAADEFPPSGSGNSMKAGRPPGPALSMRAMTTVAASVVTPGYMSPSTPRTSTVTTSGTTTSAGEVPAALRPILQQITSGVDWRERLEGVRKLEDYIQGNGGSLSAGAVGHVLKALSSRFDESNKNFVVDVMRLIPSIVEAAGRTESSAGLRNLLPRAFAFLGDQKAALREEARRVVFLSVDVVGLDVLLQYFQRPLSSDSNLCRQNTLEAMIFGFQKLPAGTIMPRAGCCQLLPQVISCLMDRIMEVRTAAEQVLAYMLPITGAEPVYRYVQQLKVAEQQAVSPAIERQLQTCSPDTAPGAAHNGGLEAEGTVERASHLSSPMPTARNAATPRRRSVSVPGVVTPRRRSLHSPRSPRCGSVHATNLQGANLHSNASGEHRHNNPPAIDPATMTTTMAADNDISNGYGAPRVNGAPTATSTANTVAAAASAAAAALSRKGPAPVTPVTPQPAQGHRQANIPPAVKAAPAPAAAVAVAGSRAPTIVVTRPEPPVPVVAAPAVEADGGVMYSIKEIVVELRSATPAVALSMCTDFMRHFRVFEGCASVEVVQALVERLHDLIGDWDTDLAMDLITCLNAIFTSRCAAELCHSSLLFSIFGIMFDCLLSEQFSLHEKVLKALNSMTLRLLEGCAADDTFSALLSRMTSYSSTYLQTGRKSDLKYIQVTVKCVMRVNLDKVSPDNVILCCNEYLIQHPPSAFRNLDDLPVRTIKTILQGVTKRCGVDLLVTANRLVGSQNLVTHFIRACLDSRGKAQRTKNKNDEQALEESKQTQRASQSPIPNKSPATVATPDPTTAAASSGGTGGNPRRATQTPKKVVSTAFVDPVEPAPVPTTISTPRTATARGPSSATASSALSDESGKAMAAIFSKARNHLTSAQGIDDMYSYLKSAPYRYEEDFNQQCSKCSAPFLQFIKRKLERKLAEDTDKAPGFTLPQRLVSV